MSGMRSVSVFPVQQTAQASPVEIDYNQQLQDLVDSSNQVKTAVDNIDQASPVDMTPVVTAINTQTALIDTFKQQSDANQISTKLAVDTVKTAVDQLKQTVADQTPLITDAISQASEAEQANLNATLSATVGALESALINEFNESQALLTQSNQKLDSLISGITGAPEPQATVSLNVDTADAAKEVVIPAGWTQGDIGPNFLDASGAVSTEGAAFDVEMAGKTEEILKNGEWHREPRGGFMGKPVPTLGARVVIKQAPSTTHVVFSYPVSQAPANLMAAAIILGLSNHPEFLIGLTQYIADGQGLTGGLDVSGYEDLQLIKVRSNGLNQIVMGDHPDLVTVDVQNQSSPSVNVSWPISPLLRHLYGNGNSYAQLPQLADYPELETLHMNSTNLGGDVDISFLSKLQNFKLAYGVVTGVTLGSHPDLVRFEARYMSMTPSVLDSILAGLLAAGMTGTASIHLDGSGQPSSTGLADVEALRALGHTVFVDEPAIDLASLVGNLYNSSNGAPYADDLQGLHTAISTGSTFADVTTGPDGVLIDTDADGTGDRVLGQAEYDALAAATPTEILTLVTA